MDPVNVPDKYEVHRPIRSPVLDIIAIGVSPILGKRKPQGVGDGTV